MGDRGSQLYRLFLLGDIMAENTIDSLYIDITSDSSMATKAIGKLISSLKVLKKEIGGGFSTSGFDTAVKSLDKIGAKTKDLAKNADMSKLSNNLKKATEIKTDSLDKFKASLRGLKADVKIPDTFAGIEKEINSLLPKYEKLIERQNKAITMNKGEEPNTKAYRGLLYDIEMLLAKQKELSRARLEMSKADASRISAAPKKDFIPDENIHGASDGADTLAKIAKMYETVEDKAKRAEEAAQNANRAFEYDDPSARANAAVNGTKVYEDRLKEITEKAKANVAENFLLPETIKNSESGLNSLINRLSAVKESLQQAFDLDKIEQGSKGWETYQYKIALTEEKIQKVKESLAELADTNKGLSATDQFANNQKENASKVSEIWQKAYENIQKNFKVPDSIKDLERSIPTLEKNLAKLYEGFQKDIDTGKTDQLSKSWSDYEYKIGAVNAKLDVTKKKLEELLSIKKQMEGTEPIPTPKETESTPTKKEDINEKALAATVSFSTLSKYIGQFSKTLDKLSGKMSGILVNLYAPLRHMVAEYKSKLGDIGNIFKTLGNVVEKAANKIRVKWNNLVHSFSKMVMRRALYAVLQTINDAMGSLANFAGVTGQKFNAAMSDMTANARYAGANIVAAFSPLVNAIAPMIDALVAKMVSAITVINQFFAALTGNNVYVKAKKTVTDYADSVKKAEKAQKDFVLGIDELNINNPNKNDAGSAAGEGVEFEWEEAPVLKKIKDFADKVKDIFGKLFDPLKKAWDRAGEYVISGFKYMVGELGKLAAAIGEDFLTMWQEEATVRIFENILGIVGDIEYTIGNLARNFREAWEENDTGLDIFRNMRDILGILVEHVRNVTQAMKDWSETVDFRPMLTSFRDMLESLKPVADFIGGVFEDVMNNVVIRYIDWMISDGIPHLNNTIASIADAFDWEKMRSDMAPVEEAFGNLAIAIHEGTVNALGNLGQALAKITNTETFTKFMENIARIINLIDAELVEKVLTALGNCILDIADALVEFVGSDKFTDFLGDVKKYLDDLTVEDIEGIIKGLAISIGLFKFGAFVGEGVTNAIKFLSTASSLAGTGGIGALASSLAGLAEGAVILGGVVLHIKALTDNLKDLRNAIKNKDVPGAIQSVVEAIWRILNPAASAGVEIWELILKTTGLGDKIKETWEKVKTTLAPVKEWIKTNITDPVGRAFSTLWENVKEIWGKVSGWFNEKVIQPVVSFFEGFKKRVNQIFEGLWILVKAIWKVASDWFKENVADPVAEVFSGIKDSITKFFSETWEAVKDIWGSVTDWFGTNVVDPLVKVFDPIVDAITGIFDRVWDGIKDGAAACFNGVIGAIESAINGIIDSVNGWLDMFNNAVGWAAGIVGGGWGGVDLLNHISIDRISWKASGGFLGSPSSYSLFGMGENGVPEILGTVGGKSAVAGGEEITGIRDQVYESGLAEQVLLGQAISLLQVIADKDFNVDLDGRSMVTALQSRSTRNGYSMATVS